MNKIFILKKNKFITGPFTPEQLKEQGVKETDKFWFDGQAEWQPASLLASLDIPITKSGHEGHAKSKSIFSWKRTS